VKTQTGASLPIERSRNDVQTKKFKGAGSIMKISHFVGTLVMVVGFPAWIGAQDTPAQSATQPAGTESQAAIKVGVIDIDRIAAESEGGKALLQKLQEESDKIQAERAKKEQEISDMQAKMTSEVVSAEAREKMAREIERKRTEAQRWLEDAQRGFQDRQRDAEAEFQNSLRPIVGEVATQNGFGLILRANPGLTMVLNPDLDITSMVIERFNQAQGAPPGEDDEESEGPPSS
jgi:Skp family chaperone for outer membrane proteins